VIFSLFDRELGTALNIFYAEATPVLISN